MSQEITTMVVEEHIVLTHKTATNITGTGLTFEEALTELNVKSHELIGKVYELGHFGPSEVAQTCFKQGKSIIETSEILQQMGKKMSKETLQVILDQIEGQLL